MKNFTLRCRADRPYRNCDDGVSIMTLEAMADEDMIAVEGMTAWSLEVLMEIKPKFTECLRHGHEEARLECWTSVSYPGQV